MLEQHILDSTMVGQVPNNIKVHQKFVTVFVIIILTCGSFDSSMETITGQRLEIIGWKMILLKIITPSIQEIIIYLTGIHLFTPAVVWTRYLKQLTAPLFPACITIVRSLAMVLQSRITVKSISVHGNLATVPCSRGTRLPRFYNPDINFR